jgi:hypothetical protein
MLLLAKILSQIAYPLLASLLLAAWAGILLWRNRRRSGAALFTIALGWLWLWSMPVFSDWVRATLEQRHPPVPLEELPTPDAIVVLGGAMEAAKPPERLYPDHVVLAPTVRTIQRFPVHADLLDGTMTSIENANMSLRWACSSRKLRGTIDMALWNISHL